MPILIPINIQDVPAIPLFDMDDYMKQVSHYATELWKTMSMEEQSRFSRKSQLSDAELEQALKTLSDYDSVRHDDMSKLTKEDYMHFARLRKTTKSIDKWL